MADQVKADVKLSPPVVYSYPNDQVIFTELAERIVKAHNEELYILEYFGNKRYAWVKVEDDQPT